MPLAIILGLAKGQSERIKGQAKNPETPFRGGWQARFQFSTGVNQSIRASDVRAALSEARSAKDSAHILAITNQGGSAKADLARAFIPAFRFRWLPSEWLSLPYPTPIDLLEHPFKRVGYDPLIIGKEIIDGRYRKTSASV